MLLAHSVPARLRFSNCARRASRASPASASRLIGNANSDTPRARVRAQACRRKKTPALVAALRDGDHLLLAARRTSARFGRPFAARWCFVASQQRDLQEFRQMVAKGRTEFAPFVSGENVRDDRVSLHDIASRTRFLNTQQARRRLAHRPQRKKPVIRACACTRVGVTKLSPAHQPTGGPSTLAPKRRASSARPAGVICPYRIEAGPRDTAKP